jgi:hypothetical protein
MSVGEVVGRYRSKEHFAQAYAKSGKLLPAECDYGWNYIQQILAGEKQLIDAALVKDLSIPPRLKDLNMKVLLNELRHDKTFMSYFPDLCMKKLPPRTYFWQVFSVVRAAEFKALIDAKVEKLRSLRRVKEDKMKLSAEALKIFYSFDAGNEVALLGYLISQALGQPWTSDQRDQ